MAGGAAGGGTAWPGPGGFGREAGSGPESGDPGWSRAATAAANANADGTAADRTAGSAARPDPAGFGGTGWPQPGGSTFGDGGHQHWPQAAGVDEAGWPQAANVNEAGWSHPGDADHFDAAGGPARHQPGAAGLPGEPRWQAAAASGPDPAAWHRLNDSGLSDSLEGAATPDPPWPPPAADDGDETATPDHHWYDDEAGPLVRLYALTRGRARPVREVFDLIALIAARERPGAREVFGPEHTAVLNLCAAAKRSVADLAADCDLPVGVIRVILSDLLEVGCVEVTRPSPPASLPDQRILQEVINGLRAL